MRFETLESWSSSFLPPVLFTWGGACIGTLLNPFTANHLCKTISKISPIASCSIGAFGLLTHLWNAKLHRRLEKQTNSEVSLQLSPHEIFCEKIWHYTKHISYLTSGIAIGSSAMEMSQLIFFCNASSTNFPAIALAIQAPFLAIAIWNSFTVSKIETPGLPPTIQIPSGISISTNPIVALSDIELIPDWK